MKFGTGVDILHYLFYFDGDNVKVQRFERGVTNEYVAGVTYVPGEDYFSMITDANSISMYKHSPTGVPITGADVSQDSSGILFDVSGNYVNTMFQLDILPFNPNFKKLI